MLPDTVILDLDVVVPVYNEQAGLETSIRRLVAYLDAAMPFSWRITIADNASTDATPAIARRLADELDGVQALILPRKGRGYALKTAWSASPARVRAYVDVDLSTDLAGLAPLVAPLLSGHSDIAIGTRLSRDSRVVRGPKREFISRTYNVLLRGVLAARFSDAQCGFKAITAEVAEGVLPYIEDDQWFFDTELLLIAERSGLRIHEVPVDWVDDPQSTVHIGSTVRDDLRGMARVGAGFARGRIPTDLIYARLGRHPVGDAPPERSLFAQLVRFGLVGVASTLAYALLYLVLTAPLGAQWANFLALLVTAIANTAANRWFTFGVRGGRGVTHQLQGLAVFALAWLITSNALTVLALADPNAHHGVEVIVLTAANLVATVLRFVLLRLWVFRSRASEAVAVPPTTASIQNQKVMH